VVEASRPFGEPLFYYKRPRLQDDDVADAAPPRSLDFDAGRVDGIFGVQTNRTLRHVHATWA
jgi:hypothetical protein